MIIFSKADESMGGAEPGAPFFVCGREGGVSYTHIAQTVHRSVIPANAGIQFFLKISLSTHFQSVRRCS